MAHPKHRTSKSKKRMRRSHHALTSKFVSICSHCSETILSHRVCPSCGYYKGRAVTQVVEEA
ncbi:MAG: 50S ribosomal protein L32 [Candidatus Poribacteria bacterium]|nr:50S ribosomal protein L32 [Candidatus Poribacteria bacterium]